MYDKSSPPHHMILNRMTMMMIIMMMIHMQMIDIILVKDPRFGPNSIFYPYRTANYT